MSKVFLLDTDKRPLDPIHPAQARQLLRNGKAAILKQFPFTMILKESRPDTPTQALRILLVIALATNPTDKWSNQHQIVQAIA